MSQTTVQADQLVFGAPPLLTVDGVDWGATEDAPKFDSELTMVTPTFQGAAGEIAGTSVITRAMAKVTARLNELTAAKLAWAYPNALATATPAVVAVAGTPGLDTTLAADPALAATNIKVASVTTVSVGDFLFVGPASSPSITTAEVVQATVVGTTGSGGTGVTIVNDTGGGLRIDHANGERVATAQGTTLAKDSAVGDVNLRVASVTNWNVGDVIRVGYNGRYETRTLTAVGTAGNGGTGITFLNPLSNSYGTGTWVIKVTGLGTTVLRPQRGRIPASAHHTVILEGVGLDGGLLIITLSNALATSKPSTEFGDQKFTGIPIEFSTYVSGSAITTIPFTIETD